MCVRRDIAYTFRIDMRYRFIAPKLKLEFPYLAMSVLTELLDTDQHLLHY